MTDHLTHSEQAELDRHVAAQGREAGFTETMVEAARRAAEADLFVALSREMAEALQALIGNALDQDHDDQSGTYLADYFETTEATLLGAAKAIEEGRLRARHALAERLANVYGSDPQEIGAKDGTEDDFGDLISEAVKGLGYDAEAMWDVDPVRWETVQDAASNSEATDLHTWLGELAAALAGEEAPA